VGDPIFPFDTTADAAVALDAPAFPADADAPAASQTTMAHEGQQAAPVPAEFVEVVEADGEIELHSAAADEFRVPDDSASFLGHVPTPGMQDTGLELSDTTVHLLSPTTVEETSLLTPEPEGVSSIAGHLPSMVSQTVDGATVALAASLRSDDFIRDFEATSHADGDTAAAGAMMAEVEAIVPEPIPEPAIPVVPVPVPNPVPAAVMTQQEILESFRRAAEARAMDLAVRPTEITPDAHEAVAAAAPVELAPAVAAVPVLALLAEQATAHDEAHQADAADEPADEPVSEPEPEPIITEAMAALYEAQGHRDQALATYRRLADRHPDQPRFAAKVAELTPVPAAGPEPAAPVIASPAFAAATTGGQSVTAFFGALVRLAPPALSRNGHNHSPTAGGGQPTRPASDPISLNGMFGDERARSRGANGVAPRGAQPTMDEFYGGATTADAGADQDLEQFHNWLAGLKA
jgi:hypothetical protein